MKEPKPEVQRALLVRSGALPRRWRRLQNWRFFPEIVAAFFLSVINFGCGDAKGAPPPPPAVSVTVSPSSAHVQASGTQQFVATVANDSTYEGVAWTISCSAPPCGSISPASTASGVATTYTPPGLSANDLTVIVTAKSVAQPSAVGGANVTVAGVQLSLSQDADSLEPNGTAHFSADVLNSTSNVNWSVSCAPTSSPCGSVSPATTQSGAPTTYTAPASFPPAGLTVTITATLAADASISNSGTITIPGVAVTVAPASATPTAGSKQTFSATVTNDVSDSGVTWSLSCDAPPCGTIAPKSTASGAATTYTAPATPPPSDLSVTITATSAAYNGASASAAVTVPAISVAMMPRSALIPLDAALQFTANVSADPKNDGVTWSLSQDGTACSPACGSVSPGSTGSGKAATYLAPEKMPASSAVLVTASSISDATHSDWVTITLTSGTVKIVPISLEFGRVVEHHTTSPLSATLTNTANSSLSLTGITVTGTNAGDFAETNTCGSTLDSGHSCIMSATFTPTDRGDRVASVSIADNSPDSPQSVGLAGVGYTRDAANRPAVRAALASTTVTPVPAPTGPDLVGTRTFHLIDRTRQDPFLGSGARELLVRFWYPAALTQPCKKADYTSPRVWSYFSQLLGLRLPEVFSNSCVDAPMSDGVHPIVVFTPGYTGTFTDYTFIFEDLASRGYVVASLDHTYEATAVELPDGRFIKSKLGSHLDNTWRGDEATLAFATAVRLQDLKFVLDQLERLNQKVNDPFAGKLDASRVAIAGHSMGGATAWLALERETRFKAAVILDSYLPAALVHPTKAPVLILYAGLVNDNADHCRLWSNLLGPRVLVNLSGAEHVTPSDAVWLANGTIETGSWGMERTVATIRDSIAAFLDANLRERPVDIPSIDPSLPRTEAIINTGDQPICSQP